jgi:hypothetical protein
MSDHFDLIYGELFDSLETLTKESAKAKDGVEKELNKDEKGRLFIDEVKKGKKGSSDQRCN